MKITVLGCGTSTGVPMVGCRCPVCRSDDPYDKRSRSSLLISYAGKTILIDTTPDLRSQMLREEVAQIDAVLYTHSHADHINGIDDLRGFHFFHKAVIPCLGSQATLERIQRSFPYIFSSFTGGTHPPLLAPREVAGPFELFGLSITPIPLTHGTIESTGYRIGPFAYLTDCSAISEASKRLLQGVTTVIIDGLRWTSHPYHFNIDTAVLAAQEIGATTIILTHLTHDISYREQSPRLPAGSCFAYDGMNFTMEV